MEQESQPPLILRIVVLSLLAVIALAMVFIVTRNGLIKRIELVETASSRFEKSIDAYLSQLESVDELFGIYELGSLGLKAGESRELKQRVERFDSGSQRLNALLIELAEAQRKLPPELLSGLSSCIVLKQEVGKRYDEYLQQLSLFERSKNLIFNVPAARVLGIGTYPRYELQKSLREPY